METAASRVLPAQEQGIAGAGEAEGEFAALEPVVPAAQTEVPQQAPSFNICQVT